MIRLTTCLTFALLLTIVACAQNADNRKLIKGIWRGNYDTLHLTLTIKENTGEVLEMPSGNHYSFKYSFKNDSIIKIVVGNETALHKIRALTKGEFRLVPYPSKIRESIELIDAIDFKRSSQ